MFSELQKRILSSFVLIPIVFISIIEGAFFFNLLLLLSFCISLYEWQSLTKNKSYYILGFIFLFFSFYCIYQLRTSFDGSYYPLLVVLLVCIFTDIGGFVFGKIFKGPKLISYSPNKTIAGLIGSYLLSLTLVPILLNLNIIKGKFVLMIIIFVIILSTVSQIGDIVISFFKRKSNIKDTGKLIPGHGGMLDRIDGMLFAFPVAYILMLNNFFNIII